jgi:ectoine hydroxylase
MDIYPTRVNSEDSIMPRLEKVCCGDADWCEEYSRNGFYVFDKSLSSEWVEAALHEAERIIVDDRYYKNMEPDSKIVRSVLSVHENMYFESFLNSALCGEVVDDITGCSSYIHQSRINYKIPGKSTGWSWHSDFETWHSQDGMPRMKAFSFMIPLVDNNEENGCLNVIPGSHKYFISAEKGGDFSSDENFSDQKVGVPNGSSINSLLALTGSATTAIECNAGDVVIFDCNLLHYSGRNKTNEARTNLFFVVNDKDNDLVDPYNYSSPRPEQMAARNTIKEI